VKRQNGIISSGKANDRNNEEEEEMTDQSIFII